MKNEYEIRGEITAIFIYKKDGTRLETLISTSDLPKVKEFPYSWGPCWSKNCNSHYVKANLPRDENGKSTTIRLHRFLFDNPPGLVVDHINHDTLNNTRTNLRVITNAQNQQNRKGPSKNNTSGVRGVYFHNQTKKWHAVIYVNGKSMSIGLFNNIKEAEQHTIEARKKYNPFSTN